ncbi:putative Na+/H+ antiporter [Bacteriovoracaceae bacterium]|nr:putative Na+/H+ antiporter [Bacteriovoracaceae bacterium]
MNPTTIEIIATTMFGCAVIHTFLVKKFQELAHKYPKGSIGENFFHFLGEVEAVFGMWAASFLCIFGAVGGFGNMINYVENPQNVNFTEPAFVFVIMAMAATRPVIKLAEQIIVGFSKVIPLEGKMAFYISALILGPILGSFITEPAAMTVTALILQKNFYSMGMGKKFKYATLGLLFVNVSIGGTLSHFAAPPVLMVAGKWGWGLTHMITNFGFKAVIAIFVSTFMYAFYFKSELKGSFELRKEDTSKMHPRWWITLSHVIFLGLVVLTAHHPVIFMGIFLFFLGFVTVTQEYQDERVQLKESLLVGFFLGGLVILGSFQKWWLQPVLSSLSTIPLYLGATGLTAITDNAALTYLGSLVDLSADAKYYLVAGAVAGGGLTVIANAPNPAGFGILKGDFGEEGISPLGLLVAALIPTVVSLIMFYFIPSL